MLDCAPRSSAPWTSTVRSHLSNEQEPDDALLACDEGEAALADFEPPVPVTDLTVDDHPAAVAAVLMMLQYDTEVRWRHGCNVCWVEGATTGMEQTHL